MVWPMIAAAAIGAAGQIASSNKASKATSNAANAEAELQRQALQAQLALGEPSRFLGYQAMGDLAQLYGYGMQPYQTGAQILGAQSGYGSTGIAGTPGRNDRSFFDPLGLNLPGTAGFDKLANKIDPISKAIFGGRKDPRYTYSNGILTVDGAAKKAYGGQINLNDGTVTVYTPGTATRDEALSAQATEALRSGGNLTDGLFGRFGDAFNNLRQNGYQYQAPVQASAGAAGQPGNFGRFFTSPDYQFRLGQGTQALDRSAAASGRLRSGAQMKAITGFGQQLGSQEYGNYTARLMQMAGLGTAQTAAAQQQVGTAAANQGQAAALAGQSQASAAINTGNQLSNLLQQGAGLYGLYRGGYFGGGQGAALPSLTPNNYRAPNLDSALGPIPRGY